MKTDKKQYKLKSDGINFMVGSFSGKTSKRKRHNGRKLKTQQNKITKLNSFYNRHPKMKEKYPKFEDWLKKVKVKQVGGN